MRPFLNGRLSIWFQPYLLFPSHAERGSREVVPCCFYTVSRSGLSNHYTSSLYLSSCIQFQFLQASCGVQGSARGLQAPAESTDRWEPDLAWRPRTENSGRQNSKAATAAGDRGPAGISTYITSACQKAHLVHVVIIPLGFLILEAQGDIFLSA